MLSSTYIFWCIDFFVINCTLFFFTFFTSGNEICFYHTIILSYYHEFALTTSNKFNLIKRSSFKFPIIIIVFTTIIIIIIIVFIAIIYVIIIIIILFIFIV